MRAGTIVQLVVMAVFAVPFLVTMKWGYDMSRFTTAMSNAADASDIPAMPKLSPLAPASWVLRRHEQKGIDRLFSPELTRERSVTFSETYPFEALLAPGETAPAPELRPLWAAARAPSRAIRMCEGLVATIALRCDVLETKVSLREDEVTVDAMVHYVPDFDLGTPSTAEGAEMKRVRAIRIADAGAEIGESVTDDPLRLARIFEQVATVCEAVRAEYGNCVPSDLRLVRLSAFGRPAATLTLSVHTDRIPEVEASETGIVID